MMKAAPQAKYYGFDLFENATAMSDALEMNVKAHFNMADVQEFLGPRATLFKGNTRYTLSKFNELVDFVWLDGGHSVATIDSDWTNVKRCLDRDAEVYLDDYYTGPIDTDKYGCNRLVATLQHEILPAKDAVKGGGFVQMVRVYP